MALLTSTSRLVVGCVFSLVVIGDDALVLVYTPMGMVTETVTVSHRAFDVEAVMV